MAIDWTAEEREHVEQGLAMHPIRSGRCAALARIVYAVARPRDDNARGLQLRPHRRLAARWIIPKLPNPPLWGSHTLVDTRAHRIDALTGADGCTAEHYLERHFQHPDVLEVHEVDVFTVDPGIEDDV